MSLLTPRFRRKVLAVGMNLAVQVAAAEANLLMRGAQAPPAPAARHEEAPKPAPGRPAPASSSGEPTAARRGPHWRDHVRRQLRSASVGLGLARLQLRAGLTQEAQATLDQLHEDIQSLRRRLDRQGRRGSLPTSRPALTGTGPAGSRAWRLRAGPRPLP
jgi:hypothetical protein